MNNDKRFTEMKAINNNINVRSQLVQSGAEGKSNEASFFSTRFVNIFVLLFAFCLMIGGKAWGQVLPSCNASYSNTSDYIANFTLGSINNSTGFSSGGYGSYIGMMATLKLGSSVSASLTSSSGSGTHAAAVWIDFNDDGEFATSERVGTQGSIGASVTVSISISIPSDATTGRHIMRVVYQYNVAAESITPCASASYGECEDYSVNIVSCLPAYSSTSDYIANFTLGNINNSTGFSSGGYGDYTSMSTLLDRGSSESASLTSSSGSGTHAAAVWIDFNDDGEFTTSERVGTQGSIGASATVSISISIPSDATAGRHFMRVVYQYNVAAESITPCASASYGECEDYSVNIVSCLPAYSSTSDYIANFTLGNINNSTGFSSGGYGDYTSMSTLLDRGSSESASLTSSSGSGTHAAAVWIDFNDDGEFTTSERVGTQGSIGASATVSISISIPSDATAGRHIMRVVYQYNVAAESITPCASASYGECEDYMIIIPRPACDDPELSYSPTSHSITYGGSYTAPTFNNPHSVTLTTYTSDNTSVATVSSTGVVTKGSAAGTAHITVTFAGNDTYCEGSATYTLTVNKANLTSPNLTVTPKVMRNTLSWSSAGTGTASYQIMRGTTSGSLTAYATVTSSTTTYNDDNVSAGTTYYYKVKAVPDANHNEAISTEKSGTPIGCSAELAVSPAVCKDASITLTANVRTSSGTTITWKDGSTSLGTTTSVGNDNGTVVSSTKTATFSTAGAHTLQITLSGGRCTNTASASVKVVNAPSVTSPRDEITMCGSGTVNLSLPASEVSNRDCSGLLYKWNTGSTDAQITPTVSSPTTYTLTVSKVFYQKNDYIKIGNKEGIVVEAPTATTDGWAVALTDAIANLCDGDLIDTDAEVRLAMIVNGGTEAASRKGFNIPAGASGGVCPSNEIRFPVVINTPSVSIPSLSAQTICSYEDFDELDVTPTSISGTASYEWSKDGVGFTNNSATYSPTTAGTYAVTVTSTVGTCTAKQNTSATLAINSPSVAIPSLSAQTICSYEDFDELDVTPTSNNGTLSYSWSKDNVGFTNNSATYSPTAAGTYAVTVTSTVGTCTAKQNTSATLAINSPSVAIPSLSAQTICSYEDFDELDVTPTSNNGTLSYSWSKDNVGFTNNSATYSPTAAGTYAVTVTSTVGTCTAKQNTSATLAINTPSVSITVLSNQTICNGDSYTFDPVATGTGLSYQWNRDATSLGSEATCAASTAGTYYVTVTSTVGTCTAKQNSSATLTVNDKPTIPAITSPAAICVGGALSLPTLSITDNGSAISSEGWQISATQSGTYTEFTNSGLQQNQNGYYIRYTAENDCGSTSNTGVQITVNTPSVGVGYDYIWRGGSADWNTSANWYMYSGGNYSVASGEMPTAAKNYYIGTGDCLPSDQWPSLSADATVGNVTINGGSVTVPANKTLSIAGSVTGTLTARDNSTIAFVGSDDQTLSDAATFSNVTIAQTVGGKKIIAPNGITVNGSATFTSGIVTGDVTFGASASATVPDYTSYVDGSVTKTLGSSAFTFPTGSNGVLGSVIVPATRAGGSATIRFNKSADAHGYTMAEGYPRWWNINDMCSEDGTNRFDHVSNAEYWDITTTVALANVTFRAVAETDVHFNDTSINEYNPDVIKFALYNGCWKNMEGNASVTGGHSDLSVSNVTIPVTGRAPYKGTFGSLDNHTVLPIELTSFIVTCDGRSTLVEWTTATERNNDYFSLERSDDAVNFTEIARVAGAGNSIEPIDYSYTDYGIHGGDNYYRLVQVDYDGTRTASEVIVANCIEPEVGEPDVQAYPNPFCSDLTVVLDNFGNRAATIEVYDMLGKLIYTDKVAAPQNSYETILNLSNLPPAAYTVRVSTNDFVINRNVVKQ